MNVCFLVCLLLLCLNRSLSPQQTTSVPQTKIESSHWCILSRENGSMEVRSCYSCDNHVIHY